jgi:hypothetical protein
VREKPVVFLHVMKCAGTSVRLALADGVAGPQQRAGTVFELDGPAALEAVGGNPFEDQQANWQFRDSLLIYALVGMTSAVVTGHFRFRDRHGPYLDRAHFTTVLRDPVDRVVSLYRYRRHKPGVEFSFSGSFPEFLTDDGWRREGHRYVDVFCGRDGLDPSSDEAIERAVSNLRRFAVVGFTDRLDDFAADVGARVGKPVSIPHLNRSPVPQGEELEPIDEAHLAMAREVCAPDYRVVEELLAGSGPRSPTAGSG